MADENVQNPQTENEEMTAEQLDEQHRVRLEKLAALKAAGKDPYTITKFPVTITNKEIRDRFEELENSDVAVAGRMMTRRIMGKASFIDLRDGSDRMQIYVRKHDVGEDTYAEFKKWDLGDIVGIKGTVFRTKMGEISVHAKEITLLSKSLLPLPEKWHGLKDTDMRYRQRYVDLVVNPQVREVFAKRAKIIATMRRFFDERGYLEVETPILQPIPGGAAARPFITHHNTLDTDLYLRIANELYLKRLIVGGFNGVYEFAKDFRNEGMDRTHNPEFTVMEIYVTYKDYLWMMDFTEEMVEQVALAVNGTTELEIWGQQVSFRRPFRRITMTDAIREKTGFDITGKSEEELREACRRLHVETDETMGKGKLIDALFGEYCERDLIQPTFVMDYPIEMSPLVKRHRNNPDLTERFELFVAGKELCNAYSELNDPIDQLGRFQEQLRLSEKGDDEAMFIDMDFVRALEYGMPPTSGMGMGIDRLTMFMTNQPSIQDVLLFPQMKPEKGVVRDNPEKYAEKGIPEEWVPVLHKMGFLTVDSLKKLSAGKLFNDLCGFNKKNKLGLKTPTAEEVKGWVE